MLVGSCSEGTTDSFRLVVEDKHGFAFPTSARGEGGPLGLIEGTLIESDGCLWVEAGMERHVVLWPRGFDLTDIGGPMVAGDNQIFRPGDLIRAGGGSYEISAFVVEGLENFSPECAAASWWLATDPTVVQQEP